MNSKIIFYAVVKNIEIVGEATKEVLCWGLLKDIEEEEPLEMEIETVASDGTLLKGILHGQKIGDTVISSPEVTIMSSLQNV